MNTEPSSIPLEELKLYQIPLQQEGLKELTDKKILVITHKNCVVHLPTVFKIYTYQTFLKAFDHTIVNLD